MLRGRAGAAGRPARRARAGRCRGVAAVAAHRDLDRCRAAACCVRLTHRLTVSVSSCWLTCGVRPTARLVSAISDGAARPDTDRGRRRIRGSRGCDAARQLTTRAVLRVGEGRTRSGRRHDRRGRRPWRRSRWSVRALLDDPLLRAISADLVNELPASRSAPGTCSRERRADRDHHRLAEARAACRVPVCRFDRCRIRSPL